MASLNENPPIIFLVSNTGWSLYNFRLPLAQALRNLNVKPVFISPSDQYIEKIKTEGFEWIELPIDRRGLNPFFELMTVIRLFRIYQHYKPRAVHHFTIKCVLYGTIAAMIAKVPAVINAVTGLGHVFLDHGIKMNVVRPIVKWLYRRILNAKFVRVIFQNKDDLNAFYNLQIIDAKKAFLIRSSGVNLQRFVNLQPFYPGNPPIVLFVGRLLVEKGITDFVLAAEILAKRNVPVEMQVAGSCDGGNPSSISEVDVEHWKQAGHIKFLGQVEPIDSVLRRASIVVLPSYREGVPRTLLEGAAAGKPLIATDVPGCREVVEDGKNGFLVPLKNPQSLANAIEQLSKDPELCKKMGLEGRKKVEREFDDHAIALQTIDVYRALKVVK